MTIMLHPSRTRHNGDTGADVQQGPAQRFVFQIKTPRQPFLLSLVAHILRILNTTEKDADVLACGHIRILHVPGHPGFIIKGIVQPDICYKDRIPYGVRESWIRGCSGSRTIPSAGLQDYEDTRLKTLSRVRMDFPWRGRQAWRYGYVYLLPL